MTQSDVSVGPSKIVYSFDVKDTKSKNPKKQPVKGQLDLQDQVVITETKIYDDGRSPEIRTQEVTVENFLKDEDAFKKEISSDERFSILAEMIEISGPQKTGITHGIHKSVYDLLDASAVSAMQRVLQSSGFSKENWLFVDQKKPVVFSKDQLGKLTSAIGWSEADLRRFNKAIGNREYPQKIFLPSPEIAPKLEWHLAKPIRRESAGRAAMYRDIFSRL